LWAVGPTTFVATNNVSLSANNVRPIAAQPNLHP